LSFLSPVISELSIGFFNMFFFFDFFFSLVESGDERKESLESAFWLEVFIFSVSRGKLNCDISSFVLLYSSDSLEGEMKAFDSFVSTCDVWEFSKLFWELTLDFFFLSFFDFYYLSKWNWYPYSIFIESVFNFSILGIIFFFSRVHCVIRWESFFC